jgi:LmbE family N-acetylglucosaminyl deacetylase
VTVSLGRRVVLVSPHLDDGVFSLGATIARATRAGAQVEVLTVFGCDPDSQAPANGWDTRGGFATEGEAATARREEDRQACRLVGAEPHWLPFRGGGYTPLKDENAIVTAITERVVEADTLLVPGFPLRNDDHAWLADLFERRTLFNGQTGWYAEQPYSYAVRKDQPRPSGAWRKTSVSVGDRLRKRSALLAYKSQLPLLSLGTRKLNLLLLQSEAISWGSA